MIRLEDLDNVKLVCVENFADEAETVATVEGACVQGSLTWGVRRETGAILSLARNLQIALALAATADEAQRKLKGEQMSHGRTKARLLSLTAQLVALEELHVPTETGL